MGSGSELGTGFGSGLDSDRVWIGIGFGIGIKIEIGIGIGIRIGIRIRIGMRIRIRIRIRIRSGIEIGSEITNFESSRRIWANLFGHSIRGLLELSRKQLKSLILVNNSSRNWYPILIHSSNM